jgi:FkbM family methyltransferase
MGFPLKDELRIARRMIRSWVGQDVFVAPDLTCPSLRIGSDYGGWTVATGALTASATVYAFGVGEDISFDLGLIARYGMNVHAFDPTPQSIAWVARQRTPPEFWLHELGLADRDGTVTFNPPATPGHVSHTMLDRPLNGTGAITVPVKRLGTIMREFGHGSLDLLKMDIEGAEYAVIEDLATTGIRPRQLLVEFHHRFAQIGPAKTIAAIDRIKSLGYRLFAVSATGEEFSFLHAASA